ncbi:glycosyltransferase family 39 protein [Lentisphaerota bacterium WC36G]|nr:glycosyltransferase family 39 protein [Lentisphaerae bacterium WC36]
MNSEKCPTKIFFGNNIKRNFLIFFIAFIIIRLLLNFAIPVTDQTEGRYALIGYEMVNKSDFLTPMFHHKGDFVAFKGKPPLAFWCEAFAIKFFGVNSFAVKLPSSLAAFLLLALIYFVLKRYKNSYVARNAVIFTGLSGLFFVYSGSVIVDMVLLFFIASSLLAYMAFLEEKDKRIKIFWSIAVFIFAAGGFLTKGPIAIFEFGLPVFLWTLINKQWKGLRDHSWAWAIGPLLFFIIVIPWFYLSHKNDANFLEYFFVNENFKRFISKDYGDKYGAGREFHYFAAVWMFLLSTLPWVLLPIYSWFKKGQQNIFKQFSWNIFKDPISGISLLAFSSITLFWSLTSRSPIHYLLPTIPMFAVYLAVKCDEKFEREKFVKNLMLGAWGMLILLTIGLSSMAVFVRFDNSTTKYVLGEVRELQKQYHSLQNSQVYFVRETPYSAYFYDHDLIINHKNEAEDYSVKINENTQNILIIRSKYLRREKVKPLVKGRTIYPVGAWNIILPKEVNKNQ